jgi:Fur family transcriptional regulator, peroxide stress response regulator
LTLSSSRPKSRRMRSEISEQTAASSRSEELHSALARAGLRYTRQREAVFTYLRSTDAHPTADQVFAAVRQQIPSVSLATVYKALEALVEAGLSTKLCDSTGPARFDGRCDRHYHLHCQRTGQVRDLETPYDPGLPFKLDPSLVDSLRRQGFRITGHRLEILGRFENS